MGAKRTNAAGANEVPEQFDLTAADAVERPKGTSRTAKGDIQECHSVCS
jgi:hypothetical protein